MAEMRVGKRYFIPRHIKLKDWGGENKSIGTEALIATTGAHFQLAEIAPRICFVSSSGSSIGGWQVKSVHTIAIDFSPLRAGRLGTVSASTGEQYVTKPATGR